MNWLKAIALLASHAEELALLYEILVTRKVPRGRVIESLKRVMTTASDEQMEQELGRR